MSEYLAADESTLEVTASIEDKALEYVCLELIPSVPEGSKPDSKYRGTRKRVCLSISRLMKALWK